MEEQKEVQRQFRQQQQKYVYYIIALSIAAIGFCVYKTTGQALKWTQMLVGIAVISWGISVFCGLRFLKYSISALYANNRYFDILKGQDPIIEGQPDIIEAATSGAKNAMETNSSRAFSYFKWQERLFYAAIFMFLFWHISEMIAVTGTAHKETMQKVVKRKPVKEVFGFHPNWSKNTFKEYNFKLLTAISYFSYELDPKTGYYKTIHDWKTTSMVSLARTSGCKVYLTVTNLKENNNRLFLTNSVSQQYSIETINTLLLEKGANGVTINFENIPVDLRENFTNYIKNLATVLAVHDMNVVLTLPNNYNSAIDILALDKYVEYFVVMGKNFQGNQSDFGKAVAPLRSLDPRKEGSLMSSVTNYLSKGLPVNKLILTLPYYGAIWELSDSLNSSQPYRFKEQIMYRVIKKQYPKKPNYDLVTETAYLDIKSENDKKIQIWFDDAKTLGKKYDYINENELAGVGISFLGYDKGHNELWKVLEEKFAIADTILTSEDSESPGKKH